jgi:hypothetical protein
MMEETSDSKPDTTDKDGLLPQYQFDYNKAKPNRFSPLRTKEQFVSENSSSSDEHAEKSDKKE